MEITIPEELAHLKDAFDHFDEMDHSHIIRSIDFTKNVFAVSEYLEKNQSPSRRNDILSFLIEYARKMVESFERIEALDFNACPFYVMVMSDIDSVPGLMERHPHLEKIREDFLALLRSEYAIAAEKFKNRTLY